MLPTKDNDIECWLKQNTIHCKLGKLTPAQCERNRSRPKISEFDLFHWRQQNQQNPRVVFKPSVCENCTEWHGLHDKLHQDDEPTNGNNEVENRQKEYADDVIGRCLICRCRFEPFRVGRITVQVLCKECLRRAAEEKSPAS